MLFQSEQFFPATDESEGELWRVHVVYPVQAMLASNASRAQYAVKRFFRFCPERGRVGDWETSSDLYTFF